MTKPHIPPTRRPVIPEKHALCSRLCRSCVHGSDHTTGTVTCDYILNTGRRRPCPAGDGCTVYKRGPSLQAALQHTAPVAATEEAARAMEERTRRGRTAPRKEDDDDAKGV